MSHSNELLPKPVNIGFTSFVCGIFLCVGIALLGNPYFMVPIAGIYLFGGLTYPGAMYGRSLIIQEDVSRVYFIKGIGWNPIWFLPMIIRLSKPVFMGKRQLTLKQNYVCLDKYAIEFEGILMVRTINPAGTVLLKHNQHAVDHQLEETIEAAARPYIADVSGMDLWRGTEHKKSIEEGIENHIKDHSGYEHDDMVLGELGEEILHVTVVRLEPPKDIQEKWKKIHIEEIERVSELADITTVGDVVESILDNLKAKGHPIDAKTMLDRVLAIRRDITVAATDTNFHLTMDRESEEFINDALGKVDPATKAAILSALSKAKK